MGLYEEIRLLAHTQELRKVENGESGNCAPLHVRIEPTEACNLECAFCWWQVRQTRSRLNDFRFSGRTRIPIRRMLTILEELAALGTLAVSFTGTGDPLMYPAMDRVLAHAESLGIRFGLTSNLAMPMNQRLISALTRAAWLRWSLNAATADTYVRIMNPRETTPGNAFERASGNVRKLVAAMRESESRPAFNASYVVTTENEGEIAAAAALVKELGLDSIAFRPDTPFARQDEPNAYSHRAESAIDEARQRYGNEWFQVHGGQVRQEDIQKSGDPDLLCFYANHTMYIDASADVYPCCYTRYSTRYVLGNVLNRSVEDFWREESRMNAYRRIYQDACPPCGYGRINRALKPLYQGRATVGEAAENDLDADCFI